MPHRYATLPSAPLLAAVGGLCAVFALRPPSALEAAAAAAAMAPPTTLVSGGATAPRLLPRAPLPPQRPAGLTGPPRPHGAKGPRRPAHGPSPAVPLPSLGLLLLLPLALLGWIVRSLAWGRGLLRRGSTPGPMAMGASSFQTWDQAQPDPSAVAPKRKIGKRRAARLERINTKWQQAGRAAARDTAYAIDLFARDGGLKRYMQLRWTIGDLFGILYLKARVRGQHPVNPRVARRKPVGRLFSYCFYLLDDDGQPTVPTFDPRSAEWREPTIRRKAPKPKRKKLTATRDRIRKRILLMRLRPPLPAYARWLLVVKRALRKIVATMDAFRADDSRANWRAMAAALKDIHDVVDAVRPEGLFSKSLVDMRRPGGSQGLPTRIRERPYCTWCLLDTAPLKTFEEWMQDQSQQLAEDHNAPLHLTSDRPPIH